MSSDNPHSEPEYLSGDPVAFGELVTRYQHSLFGFLSRMGLSQSLCEEMAQETFLRAWKNRAAYDPDKAAVSTWLFTIARNCALNSMARKNIPLAEEIEVETLFQSGSSEDPANQYVQHQSVVRLRRALSTLSVEDREVIAACYTPDIQNTSVFLQCSEGALRTRLSRARARLSKALERLDLEDE